MPEFKFNTGVSQLNLQEMFDPRKNPLLKDIGGSGVTAVRNFVKEIFKYNGDNIIECLRKESEYNNRFFEMIKEKFGGNQEDLWPLAYLGSHTKNKTGIGFDTYSGSFSSVNNLSTGFIAFWDERKTSGSVYPEGLPSPYKEFLNFATRGWGFTLSRHSKTINQVLQMIQEGQSFEIKIETTADQFGNIAVTSGKMIQMVTDTDRSALYKKYEHNANVIEIFGERPWTDKDEGNVPTYGVELEVSTDYSDKAIVDAFPNAFCALLKDGTITGNKTNPVEIVTIPASLRKHKRQWAGFFKNTNEDMFDIGDKHNNGMHVHIGRTAFDREPFHLKRFCQFFINPVNVKFLKELSERADDSHEKFAKFVPPTMKNAVKIVGFDAKGKAITVPDGGKTTYSKFTGDTLFRSAAKYVAINLAHSATVEVRIFKGIVTFASVIKNLEFCDAVLEFSKMYSIHDMTFMAFLRWLNNLPTNVYRTLRLCLSDLDLDKMIFESTVQDQLARFNAGMFVNWLNSQTINKDRINFIVKQFNEKYNTSNMKLKMDKDAKFYILKETTKYSKHSDKVLSWFNR